MSSGEKKKRIGQVHLIFCSNALIANLNRRFRGKKKPTDVLSFPLNEIATVAEGEIYLAVSIASRQAKSYDGSFSTEVCRLFLHALLHLYGYDHMVPADARQMRSREKKYWSVAFGTRTQFPE